MRITSVWIAGLLLGSMCGWAQTPATEAKEAQANEIKGMPPRANASEYQAQGKAGSVTIGAEFTGHSVPKPEGPLSTEEYVVIETGFFGTVGAKLTLSVNDFTLRINGKKSPLSSAPFGMVTSSLKDPEWQPPDSDGGGDKQKSKTGLSTGGGGGDNGPPPVVHVPLPLRRAMAAYVQKASLPEGERTLPEAGLIFFRYTGQTKNIHSIELMYSGPAGNATLNLQP